MPRLKLQGSNGATSKSMSKMQTKPVISQITTQENKR